jgi:hypothetical protein
MRTSLVCIAVLAVVFLAGCVGQPYRPQPLEDVPFLGRAETQSQGGFVVRAAVPSPEGAEAIFGIPVYDRRVQPVWIEVTNRSGSRVRFAPVGTDPDYFSPMEVWYTNQAKLDRKGGRALQRRLDELAMPRQVPPGQTQSGFVFTHASPGTKAFNVDLYGPDSDYSFVFFIDVPGFEPDHADIDPDTLFPPEAIRELDADGLRRALRELPCCAAVPSGFSSGLPLNVVLVGQGRELLIALLRAEWYEVARPSTKLEQSRSPQLYGRVPDAVFRLARRGVDERNELRVWLSPFRYRGDPVWLAQMTHYVARPSRLATLLLDAQLDPDVDEARDYLLQRMWYAQTLDRFAFVEGEQSDSARRLSAFFEGSRYFSDGHRLVLWLSAEPISLLEARNLRWAEWPVRDLEDLAQ